MGIEGQHERWGALLPRPLSCACFTPWAGLVVRLDPPTGTTSSTRGCQQSGYLIKMLEF